jgi:hypothetical protein
VSSGGAHRCPAQRSTGWSTENTGLRELMDRQGSGWRLGVDREQQKGPDRVHRSPKEACYCLKIAGRPLWPIVWRGCVGALRRPTAWTRALPPRSCLPNALRRLKEHEAALAYMLTVAPSK